MALNTRLGAATRNAAVDGITAQIGASGKIRIYDGTQPTDADTALGAQNVLAELPLSADAFGDSASGTATANAITSDSSADATGTATWGSFLTSANVRKIDFSVGTSGANLNLNSVAIQSGATVAVSAFTFTIPMQGA
jgi:hypothetical protein